jgi:RNA polymerase sigma factor (sigma-70 family)
MWAMGSEPGPSVLSRMKQSDQQLWHDILSGNTTAWKHLVDRYQSLVYTVAVRAGLSAADVADCFQATWVALYEHRDKIKDPSRLPAWLVTTSRREAIRLSRLSRSGTSVDNLGEQADPGVLPDEALESIERKAVLQAALDRLDGRCRALIEAMFFAPENHSYENIAENLGIAFNSLGPVRRRCLDRLKKLLQDSGLAPVRNSSDSPL